MAKYAILMVCTGNICRSPTADGVMRHMLAQAQLTDHVEVDSAGTMDYHVGEAPDRRAQMHAQRRGYDLSALRAREVRARDYHDFDLILAMDHSHLQVLQRQCPPELRHKVQLFLSYAQQFSEREVPDPYYGGADGFEHVLDLVEDACRQLTKFVQIQLNAKSR